jgi:hypothetical protein
MIQFAKRHGYARAGTDDDLLLPVLQLLNGTTRRVTPEMMAEIRGYAKGVIAYFHRVRSVAVLVATAIDLLYAGHV